MNIKPSAEKPELNAPHPAAADSGETRVSNTRTGLRSTVSDTVGDQGQSTSSAHTTTPTTPYETDPSSFANLTVGSTLKERFVLEEMLGRGGMGVVYKARDLRKVEARDREPYIAVKVLSREFQTNPDSFIALQREAKKAQQLAHPNIVTVYEMAPLSS